MNNASQDWSVLMAVLLILTILSYFAANRIRSRLKPPSRADVLREQIVDAEARDFEAVLQRIRIKHEIESLRAQLAVLEAYGESGASVLAFVDAA